MTPEDNKYYEAFFDLFNTDGWKQFVEEVTDAHSAYQIENLNSENSIEAAYASITEETEES